MSAPEHFAAQLARSAELTPVYLIAGAEVLLVLEAAQALRERARALGFGEREIHEVGHGFDWDQLRGGLGALSLFSARRLIELRLPNAGPGKHGAEFIVDYCQQAPVGIVLLITCLDWGRKLEGAWSRAVQERGKLVPCWPVKPAELPGWIARRMRSRGLSAEHEALSSLASRVEGNLLAAAQEVDKLALLHAAGTQLTLADIEAHCADHAHFDVFALVDAMLAGDAPRLRRVLAALRAEGEEVARLLGMVSRSLLQLARLAVEQRAGRLSQAFERERVSGWRQGLLRKALSRLHPDHWQRLAASLARLERIAKGQQPGDPWLELERLLLESAGLGLPALPGVRETA